MTNTSALLKKLPHTLATVSFRHADGGAPVVSRLNGNEAGNVYGHRRGTDAVRVLTEAQPNTPGSGIEIILQDADGYFHNVPKGVAAEGFGGPRGGVDGIRHIESRMVDGLFYPASTATRHTDAVKAIVARGDGVAYFFRPGEDTAERIMLKGSAGWNGKDHATDLVRQARAHGFPGLDF